MSGATDDLNIDGHPAVKAWSELRPAQPRPHRVELLKEERKSATYRLYGVGAHGSAVIAKVNREGGMWIERRIHEEVLPYLALSTLRCYGFVAGEDRSGWLFLEDARGRAYSARDERDHITVARWLGRLHTCGVQVAARHDLPNRGPERYLEHLHSARDAIVYGLTHVALAPDDRAILHAIQAQCDTLEARWHEIEEMCAEMPRTLIHGDFEPRNLRMRGGRSGDSLAVFDWEMSGLGVPAPDLAWFTVDWKASGGSGPAHTPAWSAGRSIRWDTAAIAAYWSVARQTWPRLESKDIRRWTLCGRLFWLLATIDWDSREFTCEPVDHPMGDLGLYRAWMQEAIQATLAKD